MDIRRRDWCGPAGLAVVVVAGLGGCEKNSVSTLMGGPRGEAVVSGDFAGSPGAPGSDETPKGTAATGAAHSPSVGVRPAAAPAHDHAETPTPRVVSLGAPASGSAWTPAANGSTPVTGDRSAAPAMPAITTTVGAPTGQGRAADAVTIDAVVGQVNGKPVLVSEIFDPLDGTLRAAGTQARDAKTWTMTARDLIDKELKRRLYDELVASEARANLTQEQKAGLLRFLDQIQSGLISSQQGSEIKADEVLRETTGRSLQAEAKDIQKRELIRNELRTKVQTRVSVPWRDVRNEYEKQHEKYNPPAEYLFRVIYTNADNADAISRIREALASGTRFDEVAAGELNDFNRREGGQVVATAITQGEGEFFNGVEVNRAMQTLAVGQVTGPIEYAPDKTKPTYKRAVWVYLERIDQPQSIPLYDAQLELENELHAQRYNAETIRYLERLMKRGNVSDLNLMSERLLDVATDRYAPRFSRK